MMGDPMNSVKKDPISLPGNWALFNYHLDQISHYDALFNIVGNKPTQRLPADIS
jgi:hypothetical protein